MSLDMKSYREQNIELKANVVHEVNFLDTNPNFVFITVKDGSSGIVYVSNSRNVTTEKYDMVVHAGMKRPYVRLSNLRQMYLLGTTDSEVYIESGSSPMGVNDVPVAEVITAIETPLQILTIPEGDNHIGSVKIDSPLPTGSNTIGNVNVNQMSNLMDNIESIKEIAEDSNGIFFNLRNLFFSHYDGEYVNLSNMLIDMLGEYHSTEDGGFFESFVSRIEKSIGEDEDGSTVLIMLKAISMLLSSVNDFNMEMTRLLTVGLFNNDESSKLDDIKTLLVDIKNNTTPTP